MSRSSILYNSSATQSSTHDQRGPSLVGGVFDRVHITRLGVEDEVEHRRQVHSGHDSNARLLALNSTCGHGTTPGRQVGEDHGCAGLRSEERRVGKECRAGWSADHEKKKSTTNTQVVCRQT